MDIRMPGSPAFHMRIAFHAFAGEQFLGLGQKSNMIVGDGTYNETWLAPHLWRREVTLADYHAVEVESSAGRKILASSDYEPSRVLMLLDAVLDPIPRNFQSMEFRHEGASGWHIAHLAQPNLSMVRISQSHGDQSGQANDAFYFTPGGLLLVRDQIGLTTRWEDDVLFRGKAVPTHLNINAGDRNLLSADIAITPAGEVDPAKFDLPAHRADPGSTLRPLQAFECRAEVDFAPVWMSYMNADIPHGFSFWSVLDRHGRFQEIEVILRPKAGDIQAPLLQLQKIHSRPPQIDRAPCEVALGWGFL